MRELLRLRWGPGRTGKQRAYLLALIYRAGGSTTIGELVAWTGRRRDNIRRDLNELAPRALVECSGENVRLVADFPRALESELEVTGILCSERLQRDRHERQREAYRAHLKERRRGQNSEADKEPSGTISELERVEALESSGLTLEPVPELDSLITDTNDPEQFRELVALARRQVAEHRRKHPPNHPPRIRVERVGTLLPEDVAVMEAIEAFEVKHGPGSFKWNQAGAKELFYSVPGGHWPLPNQLRRIREHVEALAKVVAA